jgi:uncharacterized protein (DUF885 family)
MTTPIRLLLATLLSFALLHRAAAAPAATDAAAKALHAFFDAEWEYAMEQNPTWASSLGDRRWNDRWPDLSAEAIQKRQDHARAALATLNKIDRASLSPADQLNYDLFKKEAESDIAGFKFQMHLLPIHQRDGIQTEDELGERLRFETLKDYEDWIARLRAFPTLMDQTIALMREGVKAKVLWPRKVLERVPAQIDKQIVPDPEESPFFKPLTKFPNDVTQGDRDRLAKAAREAIDGAVIPSFEKLKTYFTGEYLPASFPEVGVWQMPQARALHLSGAALHDDRLTPQQIPREGSQRSRAHPERDGEDHEAGRFHRHAAGVLHEAADGSAVLLQDAGGIAGGVSRDVEADRSEPCEGDEDDAADAVWRHADPGQDRA